MEDTISLFELNQYIQQSLELNFGSEIWINCEFSNMKNSRGHYYVDLVQKDPSSDRVIAKAQGIIWKTNVQYIEQQRKIDLSSLVDFGAEVRLKVAIDYHSIYGLKMLIVDIDANYSLGQLERIRKETIKKLEIEGALIKNKSLILHLPMQQIAIISSETAAGYIDFTQELENNNYGYSYNYTLFNCPMQGERVKKELPKVIDRINKKSNMFAAIVIIRGGGSKIDLSAFDDYIVAQSIANAKLPVLTGIGHEIDVSVADMVSYQDFKTPTAVAGFIIEQSLIYESSLRRVLSEIENYISYKLTQEYTALTNAINTLSYISQNALQRKDYELRRMVPQIKVNAFSLLQVKSSELELLSQNISISSPEHILNMGFSIVEQEGKRIKNIEDLDHKKDLTIYMNDGSIKSKIIE